MVDPSTDKDSEVHEGCREIWSTQGVQEADPKEGNDVFKIVQVGSAHAFHLLISPNKLLGVLSLAEASTVFWVGKNLVGYPLERGGRAQEHHLGENDRRIGRKGHEHLIVHELLEVRHAFNLGLNL